MTRVALTSHRLARPLQTLTGIGRYATSLARALHRRGTHRYLLVSPHDEGTAGPAWPPVPEVRVGAGRRALLARWTVLGSPSLDELIGDLDLVHVVSPVAPVPTATPLVVTLHDLFPLTRRRAAPPRGVVMFRALLRALSRRCRRNPTTVRVIVPSRAVAAEATARAGLPATCVTVLREGIDDAFYDAADAPSTPPLDLAADGYWLAVGALTDRKNLDVLVRALAAVGDDRPLVVAGPTGPAARRLRSMAEDLGIAGRLRLPGFVADEQLPSLVAGARALLHPARDEGFGLPVAEAMAAGTPVVAAAAGALPEVTAGAAELVDPGDGAGWVRVLGTLAGDDARCRDLARAGRRRVRGWRWDDVAARTEEVYATWLD